MAAKTGIEFLTIASGRCAFFAAQPRKLMRETVGERNRAIEGIQQTNNYERN